MSFGENLQFMRKMHHAMTQEELAEKMGVSRQTISKWEMNVSFPEMEKAFALSEFFNCTLDELLKEEMNCESEAYSNIHVEQVDAFDYARYAVISEEPEEDAKMHMMNFARKMNISKPVVIGWDFPFVSQEQTNVYHMHGYCAALIMPKKYDKGCVQCMTQRTAKYAVITIKNPFQNPFVLIPNAYKTLFRFIEVNGLKHGPIKDVLECFEQEYERNGIAYMNVYIAVDD